MKTWQFQVNVPIVAQTVSQVLPTGFTRTVLLTRTLWIKAHHNQWRPVDRKVGPVLTGDQGTQSQNHLGNCRVFTSAWPKEAGVPERRRGMGEVEGSPCFFLFGKSPVSSASQNTWNQEGQGSYHPVVKHPIQQWGMVVVLAIQVLTHNLDVSLLAHLLSWLHSKTDVASGMERDRGTVTSKPLTKNSIYAYDPP